MKCVAAPAGAVTGAPLVRYPPHPGGRKVEHELDHLLWGQRWMDTGTSAEGEAGADHGGCPHVFRDDLAWCRCTCLLSGMCVLPLLCAYRILLVLRDLIECDLERLTPCSLLSWPVALALSLRMVPLMLR